MVTINLIISYVDICEYFVHNHTRNYIHNLNCMIVFQKPQNVLFAFDSQNPLMLEQGQKLKKKTIILLLLNGIWLRIFI